MGLVKFSREVFLRILLLTLGCLVALAGLEGALWGSSLGLSLYRNSKNNVRFSEQEIRVLTIGESTSSIGFGNWPALMEEMFQVEPIGDRTIRVINVAEGAMDTSFMTKHINKWLSTYDPHVVVTMIGINDAGHALMDRIPAVEQEPETSYFKSLKFLRLLLKSIYHEKLFALPIAYADQLEGVTSDSNSTLEQMNSVILKIGEDIDGRPILESLDLFSRIVSILEDEKYHPALFRQLNALKLQLKSKNSFETQYRIRFMFHRMSGLWDFSSHEHAVAIVQGNLAYFSKDSNALTTLQRLHREHPRSFQLARLLTDYFDDRFMAKESLDIVTKGVEIDPNNLERHKMLSSHYQLYGNDLKAVEVLVGIKDRFSHLDDYWFSLGSIAQGSVVKDQELQLQKEAIESYTQFARMTNNNEPLAQAYFDFNMYPEALETYMQINRSTITAEGKNSSKITARLNLLFNLTQNDELKEEFIRSNQDRKVNIFTEFTKVNYLQISDAISKHGAQHMAMQYPTLGIQSLEEMLEAFPEVRFISNERPFLDGVKADGYDQLFVDNFGGSFGHCTERGNQMIASKVAKASVNFSNNSKRRS